MSSHHFLGTGTLSARFRQEALRPDRLLDEVARRVADSGLGVMSKQAVPFPGGGLTLVWVLAESHLVIHHWPEEGYVTIDLHVCDYRTSNALKARRLVGALEEICWAEGTGSWREIELEAPADPAEPARVAP